MTGKTPGLQVTLPEAEETPRVLLGSREMQQGEEMMGRDPAEMMTASEGAVQVQS